MKKRIQKRNKTLRFRVKKALDRRKNVKHFTPSVAQCQSRFRTCRKGTFNQTVNPYHLGGHLEYRIE